MLVKRLSAIIEKNIGGSLGWDGTQDAHWELGVGIRITKTGIELTLVAMHAWRK